MPVLSALGRPQFPVLLLAVLGLSLVPVADAQPVSAPDTGRVRTVSIPGSLPQARNAVVVLPRDYHTSGLRYPVLYLLHGYGGGHRNWLERTNLLAHTSRLPLIVVLPDAGNSFYVNSVARPEERFEDYIAKDVPAFIDRHFRTLTFREARYVAGLSMGGYGALKLGLKYPARFSLVGSFSGAPLAARDTTYPSLVGIFGPVGSASRAENDLLALVRDVRASDPPYFYVDSGSADALLPSNRVFVSAMSARPLPYEYHEVPGAHNWEFWNRRLPVFLALVEERVAPLARSATRSTPVP